MKGKFFFFFFFVNASHNRNASSRAIQARNFRSQDDFSLLEWIEKKKLPFSLSTKTFRLFNCKNSKHNCSKNEYFFSPTAIKLGRGCVLPSEKIRNYLFRYFLRILSKLLSLSISPFFFCIFYRRNLIRRERSKRMNQLKNDTLFLYLVICRNVTRTRFSFEPSTHSTFVITTFTFIITLILNKNTNLLINIKVKNKNSREERRKKNRSRN